MGTEDKLGKLGKLGKLKEERPMPLNKKHGRLHGSQMAS